MKFFKKLGFLLLSIIIFFTFFNQNAFCITTIGDSTFPANEGDSYIWECTFSPTTQGRTYAQGDLVNFTVDSIYQDLYGYECPSMVVYCTIKYYNNTEDIWTILWNNDIYLAYNKPLNYLFNPHLMDTGLLFIVPIPVNFSLIAETAETAGHYNSTIIDNTLILSQVYGWDFESHLTINSNGFVSKFEFIENGITSGIFELQIDEKGQELIPLGNYYLISILISIIGLVYFIKSKINKINPGI